MPESVDRFYKAIERPARILTGVAAYDGHDASILAINRSLRESGLPVEVIYQGYNKKVQEIVQAAVEEGVDCVAVSSYNGGHNQFFPALAEELRKANSDAIVVGGGGGTISDEDAKLIESKGVKKIYGTSWSLDDLSKDVVSLAITNRRKAEKDKLLQGVKNGEKSAISEMVNLAENLSIMRNEGKTDSKDYSELRELMEEVGKLSKDGKVVFIMGDGGAGKSTITDEIVRHFSKDFGGKKKSAVLSIDPTTVDSNEKTALLGDRIRMNNIYFENIFMRSAATRVPYGNFPDALDDIINIFKAANYDLVIVETPGTGQAGVDFHKYSPDLSIYVKTKEFGSVQVQLQKDQLLKEADVIVLNKIDREGSHTVFEQIQRIVDRCRTKEKDTGKAQKAFATQAKIANDPGTLDLYVYLSEKLDTPSEKFGKSGKDPFKALQFTGLVPHHRRNYLGRIVESVRKYDSWVKNQLELMKKGKEAELDAYCRDILENWKNRWNEMTVGKAEKHGFKCELEYLSFNGIRIPKVAFPDPHDKVETLRFLLEEGLPGDYPYVNGVFPMKRESGMETTRQFAGLRLAEHTNERFHFLSQGVKNPRLSTAFDGITLYGDDSDTDQGAMGKIGEGGVAVDTLDDMKILYSGFDFREISTSMTINGPAPIILAMYFNVACDYMIGKYKEQHPDKVVEIDSKNSNSKQPGEIDDNDINPEYSLPQKKVREIRDETYKILRGTVQADILKEIQAQNECIFQSDFAIKLMGDVQQFFVDKGIKKFYTISISGYHIGEAGATPIQEMVYTISNGFTYAENFLGRGMKVDEFAPNFSFFFRNSHEIEWLATGPVMRKIWAIAMKEIYSANKRSQMFKFHTQTSGRALQIPEWDTLNPIRQTVHALIALLGNTNSLHVDSADEPLTTPSEKYVRQATMIPNYLTFEAELLKSQNLLSGSYAMREIRNSVQEAVLREMERIDQEGGVGPATEVSYQRSNISEASSDYEHEIFFGKRPIIGRNVCKLDKKGVETPAELVRPTPEDWEKQINRTRRFREKHKDVSTAYLERLREIAENRENVFEELLTTVRYASLGQISEVLKEVGGRYSQQI